MRTYRVRQWEKGLVVKEWEIKANNIEEAEEKATPEITVEDLEEDDEEDNKRYCHLCESEEINGGWCTNETCSEFRRYEK